MGQRADASCGCQAFEGASIRSEINGGCYLGSKIRQQAKIGWDTVRTEYLAYREDQVVKKDVGENHENRSKTGMVEDTPKSRFKVITVDQDVKERFCSLHGPQESQEANQGFAIVHRGRTLISIGSRGFRYKIIGRSDWIGTIGAVNTYPAFAFAQCPLKRIEGERDRQ